MNHQQIISAICQGTPNPLFVSSHSGEILGVNNEFCNILGYSVKEASSLNAKDLLPEQQFYQMYGSAQNALSIGHPVRRKFKTSILTKNTKRLLFEIVAKSIELENTILFSNTLKQIETTDDHSTTSQAHSFKNVLDHMLEGLQIVDSNWRYIYLNRKAIEHSGFTQEEILGKTMMEVYPGIETTPMFKTLERCYKDQKPRTIENEFTYPNGEKGFFQLSIQPFFSQLVIHSVDISDRKKYELELENANKELKENQQNLFVSQSKLLSTQLNPHFIFNAMNSVQYYALNEDVENVLNFTSNFSKLIRSVLNNSLNMYISLEEEVSFLTQYLRLEKNRLRDKFSYEIIVNENQDIAPSEIGIPPMLLQPYVENAIIHGIGQLEEEGEIKVRFTRKKDEICCCIEDNGVGRENAALFNEKNNDDHESVGTELTRLRLETLQNLSNNDYRVEVTDRTNSKESLSGTRVSVIFPIIYV